MLALVAGLFAGACQRDRVWPPGRLVSDWAECTKSPPSRAMSIDVDGCDRYVAVQTGNTIVVTRFPDLEPLACFQARGFRPVGVTVNCRGDVFAFALFEAEPNLDRSALIMGSLRRREAWLVNLERRFPDVRFDAGFSSQFVPQEFVEGLGLVDVSVKVRGFSLQTPQAEDPGWCLDGGYWSFPWAGLARNGTRLALVGGIGCGDQVDEWGVFVCSPPSCTQPRRIPWGNQPGSLERYNNQWHLAADGRYLALLVHEYGGRKESSHVEVWNLDAGVRTARYPAADPATAGPPKSTTAQP
jgi:hypothetical protein